MLKFSRYITENVPTTAMGSARLGMIVAVRFRRKRKITSDDQHQSQLERELGVATARSIDAERS